MIDTINKLVGLFHALFATFISLYGILIPKQQFDYIYILYALLVAVSWTFYNGECILTYYIKKYYNKTYKSGEEPSDLKDMYLLFGNKDIVDAVVNFFLVIYVISLGIVLYRNKFSKYVYFLLPTTLLFYTFCLRFFDNLPYNPTFLLLQHAFKLVFIVYLVIVLRKYFHNR
jgi:hypothetical protein